MLCAVRFPLPPTTIAVALLKDFIVMDTRCINDVKELELGVLGYEAPGYWLLSHVIENSRNVLYMSEFVARCRSCLEIEFISVGQRVFDRSSLWQSFIRIIKQPWMTGGSVVKILRKCLFIRIVGWFGGLHREHECATLATSCTG